MKSYVLPILTMTVLLMFALNKNVSAAENTQNPARSSFSLVSFIAPLGIATLCLVSATFLTGLFRRKLGRRFLKLHLYLAIIAVILGLAHGILVFSLFS